MKSEKEIKDKITAIINTQIQAMADDKTHIVGNLQGCVRALQWVLDIDDDCYIKYFEKGNGMERYCDLYPYEETRHNQESEFVKSLYSEQQTTDKQILAQAEKKESAERSELISDNN